MSLDHINVLPPELLLMVFDYFDSYTLQETVSEVCQRWSEIVSHYRSTDEVFLTAERLAAAHASGKIKEFQNVEIPVHEYRTIGRVEMLEKYLFNKELVQNLVELSIDQVLCRFQEETDMTFPNLRTLRIKFYEEPDDILFWSEREYAFEESSEEAFEDGSEEVPKEAFEEALREVREEAPEEPQDLLPPLSAPFRLRCRIIAPRLRAIHQLCGEMCEPLVMYSEQIEKLVLNCEETSEILSTVGNLHFANVRRLTLIVRGWADEDDDIPLGGCFKETDFNVELKALFSRLHHLTISGKLCWHLVLSSIIGEAKNLRSLEISERKIDQSTSRQISQLKQLESLTLMFKEEADKPTELSHPKIIKLKINSGESVSFGNFPCLRILDVECTPYCQNPDFTSLFEPHHLECLRLSYGTLDRKLIDGICSLVNLSTLELKNISGDSAGIEELLRRLVKLKSASFVYCEMTTTIVTSTANTDEEHYFFRQVRAAKRFEEFVEKLSSQFIDCAIVRRGGQIWVKYMKEENSSIEN